MTGKAATMPHVKRWADDLRAVFGAAEFDAGLRQFGYLANEGGRHIDTRKEPGLVAVVPVLPLPEKKEARRGR